MSLVQATLDLLSHTGTLYAQAVLNAVCQSRLLALGRLRQQLLDAVVVCHLDELSLAALRVRRVLPLARYRMLVGHERVRSLALVGGKGRAAGNNSSRRPTGEEALQGSR